MSEPKAPFLRTFSSLFGAVLLAGIFGFAAVVSIQIAPRLLGLSGKWVCPATTKDSVVVRYRSYRGGEVRSSNSNARYDVWCLDAEGIGAPASSTAVFGVFAAASLAAGIVTATTLYLVQRKAAS